MMINYLICRHDMTKTELAQATGLTANDISRYGKGKLPGMNKVVEIAKFFNISIDALLTENYNEVFGTFKAPAVSTHKLSHAMDKHNARISELGRKGEDWVYAKERKKLAGTIYENAIDPNYANITKAGFDILSFDFDGTEICIEVKTTTLDADDNFELTQHELNKLVQCVMEGKRYEIHRVYHFGSKDVGREVIPAMELLEDYDLICHPSYEVVKRNKTNTMEAA